MDFFTRLRSTVTSAAAQVQHALPGNPLLRDCDVGEQVATAGPGLLWRIYAGKLRAGRKPVAVWVFEKRDAERWPRRERDTVVELLKAGVSRLTRLRHPRVLTVEHPMEESRDSLVLCTEPVFASLANLLGRVDNMASGSVPEHLVDFKLHHVEIRHGLMQISDGLAFLHNDARIMHRNVCAESVVVNERGHWKLAGFDFAFAAQQGDDGGAVPSGWPQLDWDETLMPCVQPNLDFVAPEHIVGGRCDTNADMFSLGALCVCAFGRPPPLRHEHSVAKFRRNVNADVKPGVRQSLLEGVPDEFVGDVRQCLNWTPDLRPDATQFSKVAYFEHITVKTLNYFEALCQLDYPQKAQFFKGLPNVLPQFPKRVLLQKVMPFCAAEMVGGSTELVPFILPTVFAVGERAEPDEFAHGVFPFIVPVFAIRNPAQVSLLLLQHMELLLAKAPAADIRTYVLPLVYAALGSHTPKVQELCLGTIPSIAKLVDGEAMKTQLLPKLLALATDAPVLSVRVNALVCLGRLVHQLEKWMVTDQLVPTLTKVQSHEPGVLMAVLGIYQLVFTSPQLGMSRESCARHALPHLIASSVTPGLNVAQFEQFMALVRSMLDKVEREHKAKLEQLSALQQEQIAVKDFNEVLSESTAKRAVSPDLQDLVAATSSTTAAGGQQQSQQGGSPTAGGFRAAKALTLEEKKRLANEQEHNVRLRAQKPLTPTGEAARLPPPGAALTPVTAASAAPRLAGAPTSAAANRPPVDLSKLLGPSLASAGHGAPPTGAFGASQSSGRPLAPSLPMSSNAPMAAAPYRGPMATSPPQQQQPHYHNRPNAMMPPAGGNFRLPPPPAGSGGINWPAAGQPVGNGLLHNGNGNLAPARSQPRALANVDLSDFDSLANRHGGNAKRDAFDDLLR